MVTGSGVLPCRYLEGGLWHVENHLIMISIRRPSPRGEHGRQRSARATRAPPHWTAHPHTPETGLSMLQVDSHPG